MRTPAQENFAPFFIRSKIAASPSRLMTVTLVRSTISLRSPSSWLAFLHVVPSSATQAPTRVPSTTSLRCDRVSTTEILNMLRMSLNLHIAKRLPNPRCAACSKLLNPLAPAKSVRRVSKIVEDNLDTWREVETKGGTLGRSFCRTVAQKRHRRYDHRWRKGGGRTAHFIYTAEHHEGHGEASFAPGVEAPG